MVKDEERTVSKEEVQRGVQLTAGHSVRLIVSGIRGTPLPKAPRKPRLPDPAPQPTGSATQPQPEVQQQPPPEEQATPALLATLEDVHFEFDKAFPLPSVIETCRQVVEVAQRDPARQLVVVAHTDPTGDPAYNLHLSEQRGETLAAYLRDDVDALLTFYAGKPAGRPWGAREDEVMLRTLAHGGTPFLRPGRTKAQAIRDFQSARGLAADGAAGPQTRRALLTDYLAAPGTSLPPSTSLRTLACGQRHPPREPADRADHARWRRVEIFLFEGDPKPQPEECAAAAHPGCTVHDAWLQVARPLGSGAGSSSIRIRGPRAGFPCFLNNALGAVVIGSGVSTDCKLVDGSTALFVLKPDGTGSVRGLPAGAYKLVVGSGPVPDANGDGIPDAIPLAAVWQRGSIVEVQVAGAGETDVDLPAPTI